VEVNKAGLVDIFGANGKINVQGESVQKLDEFANNQFINVLRRGVSCAGLVSEEINDFLPFNEDLSNQSKYVVVIDPLDGSSNIDVNISIGTIFGIYRRISPLGFPCDINDFLQEGQKMISAGYIIYGSSTMLVYATRRGVNGFTLDPSIGEFTLSHPDIRCPLDGNIYSVNQGNSFLFSEHIKTQIENLQQKAYSLRYTGSMVADLHRNMLKGGIFLYPNEKLRLVYECNPFAFILSIAGGSATNGHQDILHIKPESLHHRTPFFAGSKNMIEELNHV
jgi:fructose-1,6-bisphosphatase I